MQTIQELFAANVMPSYARFDLVLERGEGSYVWDVNGKRYIDFGGGIAVCSLGHANPEIADALNEQARKLVHVSNLYYTEPQARLAKKIVDLIAPGRVFFCNSGAEANEGLYKFARKFGHDDGRYEIITTHESFHGRTLAGIAATGQEKVKKGFEPAVKGFKHVPYGDLAAMRKAITKLTAAILIEAVQGESGITIATPEYLRGLRDLCDEKNLLLLFDEVQAGHFRTGDFQSWQRILKDRHKFLPDGISMAKALGGGFPIGAFWVREKFADVLSAGTHASTFGGNPLGCAVALKIFEVIQRDHLAQNARKLGDILKSELQKLVARFPSILKEVRGLGLMIGLEFQADAPAFARTEKSPAIQVVNRLHEAGLLSVPTANAVIRLLPPLNLNESETKEGLRLIENVIVDLAEENLRS
ncbi:MAG: acetylornithine/N-succinyldiaminopimelate aminotransferase [Verrucomicrobiota bacterium]|jgi:acetylornithine aminotransferase/acetylornithine/N-succinyldiaminopimelate aminotransferase